MTERIRGRKLQRIRADWFSDHPLCCLCELKGKIRLATELDHVVALSNGGEDFDCDDGKNRQGLCEDCHHEKSLADLRQIGRVGPHSSWL